MFRWLKRKGFESCNLYNLDLQIFQQTFAKSPVSQPLRRWLCFPRPRKNLVPALPRTVGIWLNDNTDAKVTVTSARIVWAPCHESC